MNNALSQSLIWFVSMIPGLSIWTTGIVVALARWNRHPQVSALLIASLGTYMLAALASRIAFTLVIELNRGVSMASVGLYLSILQLVSASIRALCWTGVVAAIFAWRPLAPGSRPAPLQFSIRGLIIFTLLVAVICGIGRATAGLLVEIGPRLMQLLDDIPVLICLIVGIWMATARWSRHPQVSQKAIMGLTLYLAVTLVGQVMWLAAIHWSATSWLPMSINFAWSVVGAASWATVIYAALGWRSLDITYVPGVPNLRP